jgi:hypothetical protein
MIWLKDIHVGDYILEVASLPEPHRDRECIGKLLAYSPDYVLIETEAGERIKWVNEKLLNVQGMEMF